MSENNLIKLEINNRKIAGKSSNKNFILYNPWGKDEALRKIERYFYFDLDENISIICEWSLTVLQRKWSLMVLQRKFVALNTCIGKEEKSQINNLSFHLRKLENEEEY